MKKNKLIKIIYVLVIAIVFFNIINNCCYAIKIIDPNYDITISDAEPEILDIAGKVLGIIRIAGIICSVFTVSVIGILYILASPEGKVDYKKNVIPYLVGAALVFTGTIIPEFIYNALK